MSRSSTPARSALASALASEIRTTFRNLKRHLREHGNPSDLTPSQVAVVLRLERDGSSTVSSLARAEGMRPQSMRAVVTPLQEAGLVRGAPDPNDGRQMLMCLTPKGLKWLREERAARQDWLTTRSTQKHSVADQETLGA